MYLRFSNFSLDTATFAKPVDFKVERFFKQLGLPEPWFMNIHTVWTTEEYTVLLAMGQEQWILFRDEIRLF